MCDVHPCTDFASNTSKANEVGAWRVSSYRLRPETPPGLRTDAIAQPLWFVRSQLPSGADWRLPKGVGPMQTLVLARSLPHPFTQAPDIHPLYQRCLDVQTSEQDSIVKLIKERLAFWSLELERLQTSRDSWLSSLPEHCTAVYKATGLNGPGLCALHAHLVSKGYTDHALFANTSFGMPAAGVLPPTGLWPWSTDPYSSLSEVPTIDAACAGTRSRLTRWAQTRQADVHAEALMKKFEQQCK